MDEEELRIFACDMIQLAGELLRVPQIATATAQMLFHRVYHMPEYSFDSYPLDITAMAALFLGAKIEEYPRKARELIDVFTYVICNRLDMKSINKTIVLSYKEHEKIREELITAERRLLKNLGFNLLSNYPHKIIVNYHRAMVDALDKEGNVWKERENNQLLQIAWNYCNDSLRTDVFIKYNEIAVACACIHMACNDVQMPFPRSTDGRQWYELFVKDKSEVESAMELIKNLYKRKKPDNIRLFKYIRLMNFSSSITSSSSKYNRDQYNYDRQQDPHRSTHHHHQSHHHHRHKH